MSTRNIRMGFSALRCRGRRLGGDTGPVLVFGPAEDDADDEETFDAADLATYAEPWNEA